MTCCKHNVTGIARTTHLPRCLLLQGIRPCVGGSWSCPPGSCGIGTAQPSGPLLPPAWNCGTGRGRWRPQPCKEGPVVSDSPLQPFAVITLVMPDEQTVRVRLYERLQTT